MDKIVINLLMNSIFSILFVYERGVVHTHSIIPSQMKYYIIVLFTHDHQDYS